MIGHSRIPLLALLFALLLAAPAAAWANTITAMVGASVYYLYIGNILLAFLEAGLLFGLFKLPFLRSFLFMLAANFVSFNAGLVLSEVTGAAFNDLFPGVSVLDAATAIVSVATMLAICATLLVELPFVRWAAPKERRKWRSAAVACLAVHAFSIPIAIAWFASHTDLSMARQAVVRADAAEFAKAPIGTVYFVRGNALHSIRTDGTGEQRVSEAAPRRLGPYDVHWRIPVAEGDEPRLARQVEAFLPGRDGADAWSAGPFHGRFPMMGPRPSIEFSPERGVEVRMRERWTGRHSFDPEDKTRVGSSFEYGRLPAVDDDGGRTSLSLDAPGLTGGLHDRTMLPNGQMVLSLHGRIHLYDPQTREIAELARGAAPFVLIREEDLEGFDGELAPTDDPEWLVGAIYVAAFDEWLGREGFGRRR